MMRHFKMIAVASIANDSAANQADLLGTHEALSKQQSQRLRPSGVTKDVAA